MEEKMKLILNKKPKNPIIIEGFPGLGFVGTIATEFLIEHTRAEKIGCIKSEESMPITAIHNSKVVDPLRIFYSNKYNLIILHSLNPVTKLEWKIVEILEQLVKQVGAKEIISLEGVASPTQESNVYFYSRKNEKKFSKLNFKPLANGIVLGVTAAVLLNEKLPSSCLFVETHSALPDSRGAAKLIKALDNYLNLKVDYKPLLKKAEQFEKKIKGLIEQSKVATTEKEKKEQLNYLG